MKDNHPIEELLRSLPEAAKQIKGEVDKVGRTLIDSQLKKADVVTREEFEEQQEILRAALEKLSVLEEKIDQIIKEKPSADT